MAQIVGGFILPHDPLVFLQPDAAEPGQRDRVHRAYDAIRQRISDLDATAAIIVGADHYVLFGPGCLPRMLIGVGDVSGPIEAFPGIDRGPLPTNQALARHIMEAGFEDGFDWSAAKNLGVDHSIGLPARLCVTPTNGVAIVPVYVASGVDPLISKRRAFQLGRSIGRAVASWPHDGRVVVIGSGGISHWVGTPEMGRVNEDFDRMVLGHIETGNAEALVELSDDYILREGGNGGMEVRNFLCAMGAVGEFRGEVIAYEPVPQWITGLGFAELKPAA